MNRFITELIAFLTGATLIGANFYTWVISGNIFKIVIGIIALTTLAMGVYLIIKNGIKECIEEYKDKKKGGQLKTDRLISHPER